MDRTLPQKSLPVTPAEADADAVSVPVSVSVSVSVSVVVIGYNDADHLAAAVRSALTQGPAVREVIAVDDCSTDHSGEVLAALAQEDPRVRVILRATNSGGCGSPRNDGIDAATSAYLMFLDSDDVLPSGAVDALLGAARRHGVLLIQPYATAAGNLSVRVAPGVRGVAGVLKRRLSRVAHRVGGR